MRPDLLVIGSVLLEHATQLRFVEHDEVIEAFAPNRSDKALDVAVLPIGKEAVSLGGVLRAKGFVRFPREFDLPQSLLGTHCQATAIGLGICQPDPHNKCSDPRWYERCSDRW